MKNHIVSLCLLSSSLLLTTGCTTTQVHDQPPVVVQIMEPEPQECSEVQRGCQKELVQLPTLTPANILTQHPEKPQIQKPTIHKLTTLTGETIEVIEHKNGFKFPQYPNKIVMLSFFGKNCSHCIKEIAALNRLNRQYGKQLKIISIQVDEPMGRQFANRFIQQHRISYPVVDGDSSLGLQYAVQTHYEWRGILPYTLVIYNGVTEYAYPGSVTYQELNGDILALMQHNTDSQRLATSKF